MEPSDALIGAAEISFGLVGMAGIIASLRSTDIRRSEAVGLTVILYTAFSVGFGSLFIILLLFTDLTTTQVWSISSGVVAFANVIGFALGYFGIKNTEYYKKRRLITILLCLSMMVLILVNVANATGYFFEPSFVPIFATGIAVLAMSAYFFALTLLGPVWRIVLEHRKENDRGGST